jgi:hypothetical protein
MTFYTTGVGSCGENDTGKDNIVALSVPFMNKDYDSNANPNNNPLCGRSITIQANGKTATAIVKDKCQGCDYGDIDVSPQLFIQFFDSLDKGRGKVDWWLN